MEKFKNLLEKVLYRPEEKLAILNRVILVAGCLLSLYHSIKMMFWGRMVMVYEPFYGLVYNSQKSFLGGLFVAIAGILGTYIFSLFLESFLQLIKNTRKDDCCKCEDNYDCNEVEETKKNEEDTKQAMVKYYMMIPGVGQKMAEKLYDSFGSELSVVAKTRKEELDGIKGLSDKVKEEICKFF